MSESRLDRIELLVPTTEEAATAKTAHRLATLDGKVIGFLWNNSPHGNEVFSLIVDELKEKYHIEGTIVMEKTYAGTVAPKEMLDKVAQSCDAVMTGIGD